MIDGFDTVRRASGTVFVRRSRSTAAERGEHGLAGYNGGCRCARCMAAKRRAQRTNKAARAVLAGRVPVWKVSTKPVRQHLVELRSAGWPMAKVAREAGVAEATVWRVFRADKCWNLVSNAIRRLEP